MSDFKPRPAFMGDEYIGEWESIRVSVDDSYNECRRIQQQVVREFTASLSIPAELIGDLFCNHPAAMAEASSAN